MTTASGETGKTAGGARSPELREAVRGIAHDINGVLNNLALSLELLDRATAPEADPEAEAASRLRSLSNARRAIRELQDLVERRILPLGETAAPEPGAKL
jgi:signal transduction histidine kinase